MKTFEITGSGFDGSTDATDDRVFWVNAPSHEDVRVAIEGLDAGFHDTIGCAPGEGDVDFTLPGDLLALQTKLRELFVRRHVPSTEYIFGLYRSKHYPEPYKTVSVVGDSKWQAQPSPSNSFEVVRLIETKPNPRHQAQQVQAKIFFDEQDAQRKAAILEDRSNTPVTLASIRLQVHDGSSMPHGDELVAWIRQCLNCNTRHMLVHVALSPDSASQGQVPGATIADVEVQLRLKRCDGRPPMDPAESRDWILRCLNCNLNHISAEVELTGAECPSEARHRAERGG